MRKVIITGTPPVDWIAEADAITAQIQAAADDASRQTILDRHEGFWRDARIRNWLMSQFSNKCWYTEAEESISPIHVDHFRPKGRVKNLDGSYDDGYWWLTFNWKNYVIAGHLINSKKSDIFPLMHGERRAPVNCSEVQLRLEGAVLIDPLTDQARLISYDRDDDGCIAVLAGGIDDLERFKAEKTIEILGLNRIDRLNQKRGKKWDECLAVIEDYRGARAHGAQALVWIMKETSIARLKEKVKYDAEFSSVAEACIRKQAPEAVIAAVFER
ncbi:hypothetical protein HU811_05585 [Pseudomonas sp. SWRI196]|uniref:HNH nuclease domain-containing protein n=1 Tax=Pseudomonas tehranensis TaxID=2745502 RepID=A0ABR6UN94_9PSED|nr:hypothetical protein [Pseudomonas tehranensis]MBC3346103.1 hypothetical protein [Pseudomonas tehranensis]